jgi:hypothetical protein
MNTKQAYSVAIAVLTALVVVGCGPSLAQTRTTPQSAEVRCDPDSRKESICLAALGGIVRWSGRLLTIKLENGKTTTIGDAEPCESCVEYELLRYVPTRHAIVLRAIFEGGRLRLARSPVRQPHPA